MRDLSATKLEAYQKKDSLDPIVKITLTQGATTVTLREDVILSLSHEEEPYRASCKLVCDNSDGYFTDLDLKGYKAVLSWGLITEDGEEFSDAAPLWVIAEQLDSSEGKLTCTLTMVGIPNMLAEDRASESYVPDEDDSKTVKDIINDILDTSMTAFGDCVAYTVEWDSEDSLVDSYQPKDSFRIYKNGSRLAAIRRLLDYTKCVIRYGGDEKIHILEPTTSGEVFDYEYSLADTYHSFFAKAYRKTLVIPNKVVVESRTDDDPQYSGNKTDPTSYALLPKTEYRQMRLQSNDEAEDIAEAILSKYQLNAEMGAANVPMNVGAEVFDYVKVTDEREDDSRTGNIGSLTRTYSPGKYQLSFSFGDWLTVRKLLNDIEINSDAGAYFERLSVDTLYANHIRLDDIDDGDTYQRILSTQLTAEGIVILAQISGDLDDIDDGGTYQRVQSAALTAGGLVLLDQVTTGTYGLVAATDISAGHIKLSESIGDLDDIADGNYGKIRTTCINSGYIQLNSSTRIKTGSGSEWYNESGVVIDADTGIEIWGNNVLELRTSGGSLRGTLFGGSDYLGLESPSDSVDITSDNDDVRLRASLGEINANTDFLPISASNYNLGSSAHYWGNIYAYKYYGKSTEIESFQKHNDIALLKNIKHKDNRLILDSFPPELLETNEMLEEERGKIIKRIEKWEKNLDIPIGEVKRRKEDALLEAYKGLGIKGINIFAWQSLLTGAILQITDRIEKLEAKL